MNRLTRPKEEEAGKLTAVSNSLLTWLEHWFGLDGLLNLDLKTEAWKRIGRKEDISRTSYCFDGMLDWLTGLTSAWPTWTNNHKAETERGISTTDGLLRQREVLTTMLASAYFLSFKPTLTIEIIHLLFRIGIKVVSTFFLCRYPKIDLLTKSFHTKHWEQGTDPVPCYCLDLGFFSSHRILNLKTEACEIAWYPVCKPFPLGLDWLRAGREGIERMESCQGQALD